MRVRRFLVLILRSSACASLFQGLDPDYVDFLKVKKQKALDAELAMTDEQKRSNAFYFLSHPSPLNDSFSASRSRRDEKVSLFHQL